MQRSITKITIGNELDVVLAYKRAMQLSERCGIALPNQTKFATAVSEICRNVIEYVGEGSIQFSITDENGILYLEAYITDRGRGIGNLDYYLDQKVSVTGRGNGIINSRILADDFQIDTESEKGTRVKLRKRIPASHPIITKTVIDNWVADFSRESSVSPYAEMKNQNMQLIELLEELRVKNLETENQLQEIKRLNLELLSSHEDISNLLAEREAQTELLQRKNHELDAFAHIVSHDLRSPLQNIKGLAMVIDAYLKTGNLDEAQPVLNMIMDQTNRMDNLILDILSYSLSGKNTLPKKTVNVENLLYEVTSFLNVPDGFQIHIQENMPVLLTEEIFLRQIFNNLINNAIKHHDQPGGNIWINCEADPEFLTFSVTDDGPGISAADQDRIFNQFETISNSGGSANMGLGLSIIKKITLEKGGKVWVQSEGRGSRFVFNWPAREIVTAD
ncbi:sensor histidine kinase [Adhaeribacter sp. BT258]|uniref:histidine kinase n=1 Tax=Adhaeribacter terrigena TaxID=2793070 RepID=A0ABS1BZK2_9BACT|nr:sensor histidine kinase [Adhaeribacter terrigena]MBK0402351.1 sensor histidine kinase [Adhaeribacter terrigena]